MGFAVAALAYNVLSVLKRGIEQAHRDSAPALDVSTYYLALDIRTEYPGLLLMLPPAQWAPCSGTDPATIAGYLLQLARHVEPRRVSTSKRGPKVRKPKAYVDAATASAHVSTARVLIQARAQRP